MVSAEPSETRELGGPVRWGILGAAGIAERWLDGARRATNSQVVAVASRDAARAAAAADRWALDRSYGSYEDLLADPEIDAVYLPLPNHLHAAWTVRSLDAGKHVLCEKPLALSVEEVDEISAAATANGRLASEAFMYRHTRRWRSARELIASGAIGTPRIVRIGFAFRVPSDGYDIRFDPAAGGGIAWDMGCYALNMARGLFAAEPVAVHALEHTRSGVEVSTSIAGAADFGDGRQAVFHCSFDYPNPFSQVEIVGKDGWLAMPGTGMRGEPFTRLVWHAGDEEVFADGSEPQSITFVDENPFRDEVTDFVRSVRSGVPPEYGLADARANTAAVTALLTSTRTGRIEAITG